MAKLFDPPAFDSLGGTKTVSPCLVLTSLPLRLMNLGTFFIHKLKPADTKKPETDKGGQEKKGEKKSDDMDKKKPESGEEKSNGPEPKKLSGAELKSSAEQTPDEKFAAEHSQLNIILKSLKKRTTILVSNTRLKKGKTFKSVIKIFSRFE